MSAKVEKKAPRKRYPDTRVRERDRRLPIEECSFFAECTLCDPPDPTAGRGKTAGGAASSIALHKRHMHGVRGKHAGERNIHDPGRVVEFLIGYRLLCEKIGVAPL